MPELKLLRLAIERMKNIAPKLVFKMNKEGRLIILVSTYSVQSTVTFSDLMVHNIGRLEGLDSLFIKSNITCLAYSVQTGMMTNGR